MITIVREVALGVERGSPLWTEYVPYTERFEDEPEVVDEEDTDDAGEAGIEINENDRPYQEFNHIRYNLRPRNNQRNTDPDTRNVRPRYN